MAFAAATRIPAPAEPLHASRMQFRAFTLPGEAAELQSGNESDPLQERAKNVALCPEGSRMEIAPDMEAEMTAKT